MLNNPETRSVSTIVPSLLDKQRVTRYTCSNREQYMLLYVGKCFISVSSTLMDGYQTACKAYREMEKQDEHVCTSS
ncbi:MAG: hypothetical protein E6J34_14265 [Chloroflexi bacterium]|nr:MAG: hypothetical protein E6J34_14265 [Chloroflexota bacterium]